MVRRNDAEKIEIEDLRPYPGAILKIQKENSMAMKKKENNIGLYDEQK